jgi:DnaJ-class molecular chaperone
MTMPIPAEVQAAQSVLPPHKKAVFGDEAQIRAYETLQKYEQRKCGNCDGEGTTEWRTQCRRCDGTGKVWVRR